MNEKAVYMLFINVLYDIEGTITIFLSQFFILCMCLIDEVVKDISLGEILNFFTGCDYPPR